MPTQLCGVWSDLAAQYRLPLKFFSGGETYRLGGEARRHDAGRTVLSHRLDLGREGASFVGTPTAV